METAGSATHGFGSRAPRNQIWGYSGRAVYKGSAPGGVVRPTAGCGNPSFRTREKGGDITKTGTIRGKERTLQGRSADSGISLIGLE